MTPSEINSIFTNRGFQAALAVAHRTREAGLVALVLRRKALGPRFDLAGYLRELERRAAALAAARKAEAAHRTASEAAMATSLRALQARFA